MNESDISLAAALSDVYEFDTLCTPHYPDLVKYALRLVPGRPQEANDIVQEAFLRAFRRWSAWKPGANEDPSLAARGWLHRIVQNVFVDECRASSGHRKLLAERHDQVIENTYGTEADHNIQVLSDGVGDEVRTALDSLEGDQRSIVERADLLGEQYLTIAAALGIPLGTVMSRLHRGRKRLAAALHAYAKESYGIAIPSKKNKRSTKKSRAVASDGAGAAALADVATEAPETDTDGIDRVVAGDDGGDLLQG